MANPEELLVDDFSLNDLKPENAFESISVD